MCQWIIIIYLVCTYFFNNILLTHIQYTFFQTSHHFINKLYSGIFDVLFLSSFSLAMLKWKWKFKSLAASEVIVENMRKCIVECHYDSVQFIMILFIALRGQQQNLNQTSTQQTPHTSSSRMSYGVSIVMILEKIDCIIQWLSLESCHEPYAHQMKLWHIGLSLCTFSRGNLLSKWCIHKTGPVFYF